MGVSSASGVRNIESFQSSLEDFEAAKRTVRYRAADAALQAEYQAVLWRDL